MARGADAGVAPRPDTPGARGFVHPAEWEPHAATWLAWPHKRSDWPGKFAPIPWVFAEIVRALAPGEKVRLIVASPRARAEALRVLRAAHADCARVEFFPCPTDRGWCRDTGPIFLVRRGPRPARLIVRFGFNGWAKYRDFKKDAAIPAVVAARRGWPMVDAIRGGRRVVLEGGAIDVNGSGSVLATEECLLHRTVQTRNPGYGRRDMEEVFADWLGARNTIWLGRGIAGDDTHGHVDDFCRFVDPRTVVLAEEKNPRDGNHRVLERNRERLESARLENGARLRIVRIPMPAPLRFDGQRLPASYANFYIADAAVLVPTFNDPRDRTALGILGELFAGRRVVGIHAVDLVLGLGTLHCLTHEEPAPPPARRRPR